MDTTSIEIPGLEIEAFRLKGGACHIRFSRAILIKTMTGSSDRTRWWQTGELIIGGAEVEGDLPAVACVCEGGDVGENVYTYRDMIPLPLESQGRAFCRLRLRGLPVPLRIEGDSIRLVMEDRPHYIEHLRAGPA